MRPERVNQASAAAVHFVSAEDGATLARVFEGAVVKASIGQVENDKDLFALVADALKFPDYFGHNWDALDECLTDMQWLPAGGCLLVCSEASAAWAKCPTTLGKFVSAWLDAAGEWAEAGKPFHLIFIV